MNMPVAKSEISASIPSAPTKPIAAKVLPLPLKQKAMNTRIRATLGKIAASVLPPLVMIVLLLTVWQVLCMRPGATLPSPSKIWTEAYDLIVDPFFVAGPQDIGLGWRVLTSLQRVAIGYGFAAEIRGTPWQCRHHAVVRPPIVACFNDVPSRGQCPPLCQR